MIAIDKLCTDRKREDGFSHQNRTYMDTLCRHKKMPPSALSHQGQNTLTGRFRWTTLD